MRSKTLRILLFLGLAWFVVAPLAAEDWRGKGRATGLVRDENEEPLEGVTIRIFLDSEDAGPGPVQTNKKGRWVVGGLRGGTWTVVISYVGYQEAEGNYRINEFKVNPPLIVSLNPISPEALIDEAAAEAVRQLDAGNSLLQSGDFAAARTQYEAAIVNLEEEYHPMVLQGIANAYLGEGNAALAIETLEKALLLAPDDFGLLTSKARAYYEAGNAEQSIDTLKRAIELDPENIPSLQLLIDLLVREGRSDEADSFVEMLPEGVTLAADTSLNSGITYYNNGDLDAALKHFNQAVVDHPELADAYYYRGLVHLAKTQLEQATADFKKFMELAPGDAKVTEAEQFLSYLETE